MKMIFISSNFAHEVPSHSDSSEADVFPPSSSEEEKIDKTKKNTKNKTIVNDTKRSSGNHTCAEFVEKAFPTAPMYRSTNQCLVKLVLVNITGVFQKETNYI